MKYKYNQSMQKRVLSFIFLLSQLLSISLVLALPDGSSWWTQAELLYWAIRKNNTFIPLVTSASLADKLPGALGQPGTVVEASSCIHSKNHLGFRLLAGVALNANKSIDLEVTYFLLPKISSNKSLTTSGEPGSANLAVSVYDTTGVWGLNGIPGETIAILPGPLDGEPGFYGNFMMHNSTKFQGAEVNAIFILCDSDCSILAASGGFGWMQFSEAFSFKGETHTVINVSFPSGFYNFSDCFAAKNNFYGALGGMRFEQSYGAYTLQLIMTGGIGLMQNIRTVNGTSKTETGNLFFLTALPSNQILEGGIFTQPSNIGKRTSHTCGGMLEAIIRGSYMLREHIQLSLGYNFILLTSTVRAADQIDRKINTTRTSLADASRATVGVGPGPIPFGMAAAAPAASGDNSPLFLCRTQNFWTQGLIAGVKIYF